MLFRSIYGLRTAFDNIKKDTDILKRHKEVADKVRNTLKSEGFTLYQETGFSNTVTVFNVPEGMTAEYILNEMKEKYGIMLSGSFGEFAGRVIRIGHMGENARMDKVEEVLEALLKICRTELRA